MASCSIANTLPGNLLPVLSKLRKNETYFSAKSSVDEYDDYVSLSDLRHLTDLTWFANDMIHSGTRVKKLRVLAREKILSCTDYTRASLKEKGEKKHRNLFMLKTKDTEGWEDMEIGIRVIFPSFALQFMLMLENKATMMKLEVLSFIFKLWLRRIQLTRQEDNEKYNGLQDFEYAIYKAREVIKQFKDFIYKQCYNRDERQQMLPYYEHLLKEAANETFEEKEKASFKMLEEDVVRFRSNGARICALLGLKLDFLDRFEKNATRGPRSPYALRVDRNFLKPITMNLLA
ncbi:hypothetical protein OS493_037279 [Desmophyllum pertusum]|uniref:Uncharacterized protein n=1 Tax=Desmophyllum pertusum TaxID=174260 RepID=A0A9X0CC77_9CNID|nr:hypothetical protein OS493_037279 [Desmophyllum pertusum]